MFKSKNMVLFNNSSSNQLSSNSTIVSEPRRFWFFSGSKNKRDGKDKKSFSKIRSSKSMRELGNVSKRTASKDSSAPKFSDNTLASPSSSPFLSRYSAGDQLQDHCHGYSRQSSGMSQLSTTSCISADSFARQQSSASQATTSGYNSCGSELSRQSSSCTQGSAQQAPQRLSQSSRSSCSSGGHQTINSQGSSRHSNGSGSRGSSHWYCHQPQDEVPPSKQQQGSTLARNSLELACGLEQYSFKGHSPSPKRDSDPNGGTLDIEANSSHQKILRTSSVSQYCRTSSAALSKLCKPNLSSSFSKSSISVAEGDGKAKVARDDLVNRKVCTIVISVVKKTVFYFLFCFISIKNDFFL